jgi:hypothetical protein
MNLEDPLEEMERRVAAMMMRHQISADDLRGRLFLHSGRDRRLLMASRSADGFEYMHPDRDAVIAGIRSAEIGCVIVDPYVKSHTLEENSNADMDAAVTAWAEVGEQTGAAILLVHHTRKGAVVDIESSRGGKALTDASRVGLTMAPMTAEEGDQLGVPEGDRWQHVRLDDAKANMAPKAGRAAWFKLEIQSLGNATSEYPNGDHVASIAPWTPPNPMAGITVADINLALDRIAEGPKPGVLYAATRRGRNNDRWVGSVLVDAFGLNDAQASGMLAAWFKSGLLSETTYRDAQERKDRSGVAVDDSKRPA